VEFILEALGFEGQDLILADEMLSHGMIPTQVVRCMLKKNNEPKPQPEQSEAPKVREYTLKQRPSIQSK